MKILYFAWLRQRVGAGEETIDLPEDVRNVAGLIDWLKTRGPKYEEAFRDTSQTTDVPPDMLGPGEHYALEIAGDSMVDAGILDGDIAIIRRADTADNGTIVVALVDDMEVTLKRLRKRGHTLALEAANPAYETRIFGPDRVRVQGRLVGLMRRYS